MICSSLGARHHSTHKLKNVSSEDKSSAVQPLAWLSPMINILFLCDSEIHLFLIFAVAVFSTKPGKLEASDSSWSLSGSVKQFTIVGTGCWCCASGCLLYVHLL